MESLVSIIIPNRNGADTIGTCLAAAQASHYGNFEIIVVDDGSEDNSIEVIKRYPCKLVRLERHGGAAQARNAGASHSRGRILFFTDADCLLLPDTLALAAATLAREGSNAIIGGTYTPAPHDRRFFSRFQSAFINYFETRHAPAADYIATHALAVDASVFRCNRGFAEEVRPVLEDVEFSHRLRRAGCKLVMNPAIRVRHIFNYSLMRSLRNAFTKSLYWTGYAIRNRDLLADSGTASVGLKLNVLVFAGNAGLLYAFALTGKMILLALAALAFAVNLFVNWGLLLAYRRAEGPGFALLAALYYLLLYPLAVGAGAGAGLLRHLFSSPVRSQEHG
ncbi:MAG: glycosyltransferase [Betaproteobacteria bacterium]|nr:MAG: glycosyltransferase [Betaproteobacteria bacterium]